MPGTGAAAPGIDGIDGAPAIAGAPGTEGIPGAAPGIEGAPAIAGAPGIEGIPGAAPGIEGIDGAPGIEGIDGIDGAPGTDGADAAPGIVPAAPCACAQRGMPTKMNATVTPARVCNFIRTPPGPGISTREERGTGIGSAPDPFHTVGFASNARSVSQVSFSYSACDPIQCHTISSGLA